jgi:hypothetical protein
MTTTASTRRSAETSAPPSGDSSVAHGQHAEAVREVIVHAARIQLASITALSRFLTGWVQSADRYAQAVSDELLARVSGETASSELVGRLAAASSLHLREVTELPTVAVRHFNNELTKPATSRKRTQKRARSRATR